MGWLTSWFSTIHLRFTNTFPLMMLCGHVYGRPVIKPLPWLQERNNAKYTCFYNEMDVLLSDFHQHKLLQWVVHITILPKLLTRTQIIFSTIDVVRDTTCSIRRHYCCKTATELKGMNSIAQTSVFRTCKNHTKLAHSVVYPPPPPWCCGPTRAMASSFLKFLDHTQRPTTVGRTSLDAWSASRRDLYLTVQNTRHRQTSMPPAGFEPTIPASERQ